MPIFLMLTGFLLLDRKYDTEAYKQFLKTKWLHLLLCTWIWFAIYEVFIRLHYGEPLSAWGVLRDMLFLRTIRMSHAWYLPMILGIYLLLPLAANALHTVDFHVLKLPFAFFSAYVFLYAFVNTLIKATGGSSLTQESLLGFSGGAFGIYVFIRYLLKQGILKKIRTIVLIIALAAALAAGLALYFWTFKRSFKLDLWYDSPIVLVGSTAALELLSRISKIPLYFAIRFMARHSLGVYLVHMIVLRRMQMSIERMGWSMPVKTLALGLLVLALSYGITMLISLIPVMK